MTITMMTKGVCDRAEWSRGSRVIPSLLPSLFSPGLGFLPAYFSSAPFFPLSLSLFRSFYRIKGVEFLSSPFPLSLSVAH